MPLLLAQMAISSKVSRVWRKNN